MDLDYSANRRIRKADVIEGDDTAGFEVLHEIAKMVQDIMYLLGCSTPLELSDQDDRWLGLC